VHRVTGKRHDRPVARIARDAAPCLEGVIVIRTWCSDMRDFTRLTDTLPQAEMLGLLNDYAEPVVDAITREDGEVL
jgi:class 3 adenylate cyclase